MPNFPGDSGSAAQKTIAAALTTAVSASSSGWNSSQDVNCTAANLTISLPTPTIADFGKIITLRNIGINPFTVALTGGTLNSAVGLTMNPGSVWTFEAQTLTTANVSATNATQTAVEEYCLVSFSFGANSSATPGTANLVNLESSPSFTVSGTLLTLKGGRKYGIRAQSGAASVGTGATAPPYMLFELQTAAGVILPNQVSGNSFGAYGGTLNNFNGPTNKDATVIYTPAVDTQIRIQFTSGNSYGATSVGHSGSLEVRVLSGQAAVSTTPTTPQGFALVNISNPSIVPPAAITSANAVGSTLLGGNLTTTSGNNGIICKAGKTYFVEVALSIDNYGGANTNFPFASFDICSNMSTTVLPGSSTGRATMQNLQSTPSIGAGNNGGPRPAYAVFTPTVDTPVNVTVRTMGQSAGGAAITAVLITGTMSVIEVGMTGTVVNPVTGAVNVNNTALGIAGLYDVAATRLSGNVEFFEDVFLRMDFNAGNFRIAAVGTPKNVGVYGLISGSAGNMDASSAGTFPINTNTPLASSLWKASFGAISVGVFTIISDATTSADYDDIQIYWIQMNEAGVKYRVTIMGGNSVGCIVERWNTDRVTLNTKITLPN
jgi:hypothetical protein